MNIHPQSRRKLLVLACLYLSQGLPFGFFTQALPVFLRQEGHSLTAVGLSSALAAPWGLKFLWAPLVDRYSNGPLGRRRSWLLPLQLMTVLLLTGLALVASRTQLSLLMGGVLLVNLLAATQDIATDALAVDVLQPEERGLGNGIQVAGYRAGMVVGGGALLVMLDSLGLAASLLALAAALAVATLPVWRMREAPMARAATREPTTSHLSVAAHSQRSPRGLRGQRGLVRIVAVLVTYKLGDALATAMLRPMLVDQGFSLSDIGWALGVVAFGAGLAGALAGAALIEPLGRRGALVGFGALQSLGVAGYALLATQPRGLPAVCAFLGFEHFAGGMATVGLFTCMMDWCRPERAASDYTRQASAVVFATGMGALLAGVLADSVGYATHFSVAAFVSLAGVVFVALGAAPAALARPVTA